MLNVHKKYQCLSFFTQCPYIYGIYLWFQGAQESHLEKNVNLPKKVAIKLCQKLRACCSYWLNRNPITMGGNVPIMLFISTNPNFIISNE